MPRTYAYGEADTLLLRWQPLKVTKIKGVFKVPVHILFRGGESNVIHDTLMEMEFEATDNAADVAFPSDTVDFDRTLTCHDYSRMLACRNLGCRELTLDSCSLDGSAQAAGYTLTSSGPVSIDSMVDVLLSLQPQTGGELTGVLTLYFSSEGRVISRVVTLHSLATQSPAVANLSRADWSVPPITICEKSDVTPVRFFNTGCDSLVVLSASLVADPEFSVDAMTRTLPAVLKTNDTLAFALHFANLKRKGHFTGDLRLTYRGLYSDTIARDTLIHLAADVGDGTKTLAVDSSLRDFGVGSFCRQQDTMLVYENTGCDTLTVYYASLTGADFLCVRKPLPKRKLAPGERDTIIIRYVPTAPGTSQATVSIFSDDSRKFEVPITLTAASVPRQTFGLRSVLSKSGIRAGDTTSLSIYPTNSTTQAGLRTIDFTLEYAEDLLSFVLESTDIPGATLRPHSSNRVGRTVSVPIHIEGDNLELNETEPIYVARFQSFLADTSRTTLRLTHFALNGGDAQFAKCNLALANVVESPVFNLAYECGDELVAQTLRERSPFVMESVRPNPASDQLHISIRSLTTTPIDFQLIDALGRVCMTGSLTDGSNTLDVHTLAEGAYYLRSACGPAVNTTAISLRR